MRETCRKYDMVKAAQEENRRWDCFRKTRLVLPAGIGFIRRMMSDSPSNQWWKASEGGGLTVLGYISKLLGSLGLNPRA